jgi:hypothetical protein
MNEFKDYNHTLSFLSKVIVLKLLHSCRSRAQEGITQKSLLFNKMLRNITILGDMYYYILP